MSVQQWSSWTWTVPEGLPAEGEPVEQPSEVWPCAMCRTRLRVVGGLDCAQCRAEVIAEEERR